MFHGILTTTPVRFPLFVKWYGRLSIFFASRYTSWLLLALGITRAIVFVIAYPPAHGADSADYFLYAAQFERLNAPTVFGLIYPLYPLLIYITHYVLGNIYLLILLQLGLSAVQGIVFYLALRLYSPVLGFMVALAVLGDAQTGILYNFTSTEPLYMFLLNLAFALFLIQIHRPSARWIQVGDILLGVLLASILLARPVGRYLIIPFGALFLLSLLLTGRTQRAGAVIRTGVVGLSYALALGAFMLFNRAVFDRLELNGSSGLMLASPLIRSGLFEADNGPASAKVASLRESCPEGENRNRCLTRLTGDWTVVQRLYAEAYQEMLDKHLVDYLDRVADEFTKFLQKPGLQYHGAVTPSDVQCADIEATVDRETTYYLEQDALLLNASNMTYDTLWPILYDIDTAMCPSWPDNDGVRRWVDRLAMRYRSFSRPRPYLWYGVLGILVLIIPWARRYLILVLIAGAVLANHAAISAAAINVQPRYIAVANPYKEVLMITLLFIFGVLVIRILDTWLVRHSPPVNSSSLEQGS